MTIGEFAYKVVALAFIYQFSVTSWGRTAKYNTHPRVGGIPTSFHRLWLAVDCEPDGPVDAAALERDARKLGLQVVVEEDHFHLEPLR